MDTLTITADEHNSFRQNHLMILDYINLICAENPIDNMSKFEEDLEFGMMYLNGGSITTAYSCGFSVFKRLDVFSHHLKYSKQIGSPLKMGDSLMRCFELAFLYIIYERIPTSTFVHDCPDEYVSTPFFDFEGKTLPLVYRSTITAVLASGESVANFYLKLLEFNLPSYMSELEPAMDENWIVRVSEHQNEILNGVVLFEGVFKRRSVGVILDLLEMVIHESDSKIKDKLTKELTVLYGNYLIYEFTSEWAKLDNEWVIMVHQKFLCYPFSVVESAVNKNDSDILFKDLLRTDKLVRSDH